jgi:hypothetical protein
MDHSDDIELCTRLVVAFESIARSVHAIAHPLHPVPGTFGSDPVRAILSRIATSEHNVMSKLTQLAAAIAALGVTNQAIVDGITNLGNVMTTEDAAIQAAIARLGQNDDPAVQALIDAVTNQQANLTSAATQLTTAAQDAVTQTGALQGATGTAPPTITGFDPQSGPATTPVTISGTGFIDGTQVTFTGSTAHVPDSISADGKSLVVGVPSDAQSGPITVETANGSVASSDAFSVG